MFNIKIDGSKKIFIIKVGGYFKQDEVKAFIEDYKKNVKSINPEYYSIAIIGEELITTGPDLVSTLENIVNLYKETGFKKYYGSLPSSPLAAMQLKRIITKCGLDVTFADNIDDILNIL